MILHADLHIHSALSPCADNDMTPGNIVVMASLAGLNVIAITDHNIALNVGVALEFGKKNNVLVIPGMELETQEEIHVVCLFPTLDSVLSFQEKIKSFSMGLKNNAKIFGNQYVYDCNDEISYEYENMLLCATNISIDDVFKLAKQHDGIAYPAHVDRDSYSVYSQLGALPYKYPHDFVEVSSNFNKSFLDLHPELNQYKLLRASDSHYLSQIDKSVCIDCDCFSARSVIESLGNSKFYIEGD